MSPPLFYKCIDTHHLFSQDKREAISPLRETVFKTWSRSVNAYEKFTFFMEPTDDRQDVIPIVCQVPDGDLPHTLYINIKYDHHL